MSKRNLFTFILALTIGAGCVATQEVVGPVPQANVPDRISEEEAAELADFFDSEDARWEGDERLVATTERWHGYMIVSMNPAKIVLLYPPWHEDGDNEIREDVLIAGRIAHRRERGATFRFYSGTKPFSIIEIERGEVSVWSHNLYEDGADRPEEAYGHCRVQWYVDSGKTPMGVNAQGVDGLIYRAFTNRILSKRGPNCSDPELKMLAARVKERELAAR